MLKEIKITQEWIVTALVQVYSSLGVHDEYLDFVAEKDNPNTVQEVKDFVKARYSVPAVIEAITATSLETGEKSVLFRRPKSVPAKRAK